MEKMQESQSQLVAFNIILFSGNARSLIHEAMECMRNDQFEQAKEKLEEADQELVQAHQAQTDLLQAFSRGTIIEIQIIMVHAQDHLMTTMTLLEVAKEMKHLYKKLSKLSNR